MSCHVHSATFTLKYFLVEESTYDQESTSVEISYEDKCNEHHAVKSDLSNTGNHNETHLLFFTELFTINSLISNL